MKKQIFLTSAMAATLSSITGCSSADDWDGNSYADADTSVCVDQAGIRVEDLFCDDDDGDGFIYVGGIKKKKSHGWYYVNRGSPLPYHGDSIRDSRYKFSGSSTPAAGAVYARAPASTNMTRSSAVSRGGLGSSSGSYGGGRS